MLKGKPPARRCAVYTRKSSEERLEQDFNSLHAQREACEAFIRSQRAEGWLLVEAAYDDGGLSGGTMHRPALQRLLADIAQDRVDVVVVYKVDRLSRSLMDFAKIVELLDRHGASFVAVTQQFNTTTSMGRLTLNILLSFAQFEREVTGERIRDKIAASKRKGMWMGGVTPLGYEARDRKLVMSVKDDFDRIVGMERAKLESAARRHAEFPERQQQRFLPLQLLLEELGASVDGRFLRIRMEDSGATVEVGKPKPDASFFATDMQWQLRPNYSLHFSASARDYLFNEEPGFRVAETRCPRFPADDAFTTILLFETETQVIEHLVQMVAKRIAEYLCTAQDRS